MSTYLGKLVDILSYVDILSASQFSLYFYSRGLARTVQPSFPNRAIVDCSSCRWLTARGLELEGGKNQPGSCRLFRPGHGTWLHSKSSQFPCCSSPVAGRSLLGDPLLCSWMEEVGNRRLSCRAVFPENFY